MASDKFRLQLQKVTYERDKTHHTTKVPDGHARFLTTRQKPANEKGFVGFETVWEPFQKEAEYKTPKKP